MIWLCKNHSLEGMDCFLRRSVTDRKLLWAELGSYLTLFLCDLEGVLFFLVIKTFLRETTGWQISPNDLESDCGDKLKDERRGHTLTIDCSFSIFSLISWISLERESCFASNSFDCCSIRLIYTIHCTPVQIQSIESILFALLGFVFVVYIPFLSFLILSFYECISARSLLVCVYVVLERKQSISKNKQ